MKTMPNFAHGLNNDKILHVWGSAKFIMIYNSFSRLQGINWLNICLLMDAKGQIKSEWIYEIVNQAKIATEKFEGFLP